MNYVVTLQAAEVFVQYYYLKDFEMKRLFSFNYFCLFIIFFLSISDIAISAEKIINYNIPKVGYIQWLAAPKDAITDTFDNTIVFKFSGEKEQNDASAVTQDLFLGMICNSLDGYQISFFASSPINSQTAYATSDNGQSITYQATLEELPGTFHNQSKRAINFDLLGLKNSVTVSFLNEESLPLSYLKPNVLKMTLTVLDAEIYPEDYMGSITAIMSLP
jgi:hypothetical protein